MPPPAALSNAPQLGRATLDTHHGALQHVFENCQLRGLERTVPTAFDQLMRRGRERGLGNLDFTALVQLMS